ncbi:NUF2 [[Candida] subhashii]|uniref:NUF2 n=1 Tax=[Candida] subhashii TaxID=561895 RepID=A0A8J5QGB5_9ASCO|nr:NUF2 [[Candida] subhashii]KAG7662532.1 NUF2 [[Candida] subhashii]
MLITAGTVESKARELATRSRQKHALENGHAMGEQEQQQVEDQEQPMGNTGYRLRVLHRYCFNFFSTVGFYDFGFYDLYKPDPIRTQRILSAVINFARYREHLFIKHEAICERVEKKIAEVKSCRERKTQLENKLNQIKKRLDTSDPNNVSLKNINAFIARMEEDIRRLKVKEGEYFADRETYKSEKARLVKVLQANEERQIRQAEELEELNSFVGDNLHRLNDSIETFRGDLERKEARYNELKQQYNNLTKTFESVKNLEEKVRRSLKLAEDVAKLDKQEEDEINRARTLEANLSELHRQTENISRLLENVYKQIAEEDENFKELEKSSNIQIKKSADKVNEVHKKCSEKQQQVKQMEDEIKKMQDAIGTMENEIQSAVADFEVEKQNIMAESQRVGNRLLTFMQSASVKLKDAQDNIAN